MLPCPAVRRSRLAGLSVRGRRAGGQCLGPALRLGQVEDPEQLLRALASERLGTSEEALSNPLVSATSGALSTAIGATIPVIPFFFMTGIEAVVAAAIISLAAHFAVGAAKSLITIRSWWSSGFEMTIVGAVEGAVTYGIGILLGKGGM